MGWDRVSEPRVGFVCLCSALARTCNQNDEQEDYWFGQKENKSLVRNFLREYLHVLIKLYYTTVK